MTSKYRISCDMLEPSHTVHQYRKIIMASHTTFPCTTVCNSTNYNDTQFYMHITDCFRCSCTKSVKLSFKMLRNWHLFCAGF